jgi:hypothetical protein
MYCVICRFQAGAVITELNLRAMQMGNGSDQRKAEAAAGHAAAGFKPTEASEDILAFLDTNTRPVIAYHRHGLPAFFIQGHPDLCSGRCMTEGIQTVRPC